MKPNAPSVIQRSLKWQLHVAFTTKDPRQKKRAIEAAGRLIDELCEAITADRAEHRASATEQTANATDPKKKGE